MNKKSWILAGIIILVFAGILVFFLFGRSGGNNATPPPRNGGRAEIEKVLYGLYDAYNSGDINKAVSYYDVQSKNDKEMLFEIISAVRKMKGPKTIKLISVQQKSPTEAVALVTFADGTSDDYNLVKGKGGVWLFVFGGAYIPPSATIAPTPTPTPEPQLSVEDEKAIKEILNNFFEAFKIMDAEKMLQYVAPAEQQEMKLEWGKEKAFKNVILIEASFKISDPDRNLKPDKSGITYVVGRVEGEFLVKNNDGIVERKKLDVSWILGFKKINNVWFIVEFR